MFLSDSEIDAIVGQRVRERREALRMSQTRLGRHLGLTFSQIQKYEKGANRIGAGRLQDIANILRVPVAMLFDDKGPAEDRTRDTIGDADRPDLEPADLLRSDDGLALARSFVRITDAGVRRRVVRLVEELSKTVDDCRSDAIAFSDAAAIRAGRSDSDRA